MTPIQDYIIYSFFILGAVAGIGLIILAGTIPGGNEIILYIGLGTVAISIILGYVFITVKYFNNVLTTVDLYNDNQPTPSAPALYN